MTGYDYGNARLRARGTGLLGGDQYAALLGRDGPGLLAALAATCYRPQAEAAQDGARSPLEQIGRIAHDHLVAALAGIGGFYRDLAQDVVAALLGRFDVHNVVALLRARHRGATADAACALLVPVGRLDADTARQAAGEPDLPAAARFLAARGLPGPGSAPALMSAQRRYEIDADLAPVEEAVARSAWDSQLATLAAAGPGASPALAALQREADDLNLLLALRLREPVAATPGAAGARAGAADGGSAGAYLPGGTVGVPLLTAIRRAPAPADVLAAAAPARPAWRRPLAAWADGGDLATLHADLDTDRLRTALRLLRRGDPLGAAPVLHYVLAHLAQARNLRLLAQAGAGAVGHDEARRHLVAPGLAGLPAQQGHRP